MKKRLLPALLALALVLGLLPLAAFAAPNPDTDPAGLTMDVSVLEEGNGATVEKNSKDPTKMEVTITLNENLPWSAADESDPTKEAGWRVGVKFTLPEGTDESQMGNIYFMQKHADEEESAPAEFSGVNAAGTYSMTSWCTISEALLQETSEAFNVLLNDEELLPLIKEDGFKCIDTYTWYFFDINNSSELNTANADLTVTVNIDYSPATVKLMKDGKQVWPASTFKPAVSAGGTPTVSADAMDNLIKVADNASDKTATIDVGDAGSLELGKDAVAAANGSTVDGLKLAVKSGDLAVAFDKTAIGAINTAASGLGDDGKVTISIKDVTTDNAAEKPEGAVAAYEAKVDGVASVTWGNSEITLTVPAPTDADGSAIAANKLEVYLDNELDETIKPVANGTDKIDITVPHLTVVALKETTGGGNPPVDPDNPDDPPTPAADTVTISASTNGTVTADNMKAKAGDKVALTVTPDSNYVVKTVEVAYTDADGTAQTLNLFPDEGKYTFTMPADAVTVTATFIAENDALTVTNVAPEFMGFAAVKVAGMQADRAYVIRLAKSAGLSGDSIMQVVTGVTDYTLTCKDGQKIFVLEVADKAALAGFEGADGNTHLNVLVSKEHTAAVVK